MIRFKIQIKYQTKNQQTIFYEWIQESLDVLSASFYYSNLSCGLALCGLLKNVKIYANQTWKKYSKSPGNWRNIVFMATFIDLQFIKWQ